MTDLVKFLYSFCFSLFGIKIDSTNIYQTIYNMLNMSTSNGILSSKFGLYQFVATIHSVVVPVAESLVVLFFMVNLIKTLTQEGVERVSWERITLKACVFFLLLHFIQNSTTYMGYIAETVQSIFVDVTAKMTVTGKSIDLGDTLVSIAKAQGGIAQYGYCIVFIILAIPYMATIIMILSQVFVRAVKLLIYIMFAPIPLALACEGETYRGKCISYFMNFAGVCFEAIFIYIGLVIYCTGLKDMSYTDLHSTMSVIIEVLFLNGLFSAMITLSSQLSEKIFGRG